MSRCQVCGRMEGVGASGCLAWTGGELARRECRAVAEMPKREALTCPDDLHPAATIQGLRATLATLTAERDALLLVQAESDYAACAQACGVEYVPDTGPTWPGPVKDVVAAIVEGRRAIGQAIDLRAKLTAAERDNERTLVMRAWVVRWGEGYYGSVELWCSTRACAHTFRSLIEARAVATNIGGVVMRVSRYRKAGAS